MTSRSVLIAVALVTALALPCGAAAHEEAPPRGDLAVDDLRPARTPNTNRSGLLSLGVDLGDAPLLYALKAGIGVMDPLERLPTRTTIWLELDWAYRLARESAPDLRDNAFWFYPHLELATWLARPLLLLGYVDAGPTVGRYSVRHQGGEDWWFAGLGAGAGIQWALFRGGVRYHAQWKDVTSRAGGEEVPIAIRPRLLFNVGLELPLPIAH